MNEHNIVLPYPPTVNHYWERNHNGTLRVGRRGIDYRLCVLVAVRKARFATLRGKLVVEILAQPPDNRRRDIDNLLKSLLDALQHAGFYEDDNQVWRLTIERGEKIKDGRVTVKVLTT